ncbi:MAG: hypothetical protein H7A37_00915 [Chlamydiales bacterium]|nr:hypothetical protein [Chlamydiales bacterium]
MESSSQIFSSFSSTWRLFKAETYKNIQETACVTVFRGAVYAREWQQNGRKLTGEQVELGVLISITENEKWKRCIDVQKLFNEIVNWFCNDDVDMFAEYQGKQLVDFLHWEGNNNVTALSNAIKAFSRKYPEQQDLARGCYDAARPEWKEWLSKSCPSIKNEEAITQGRFEVVALGNWGQPALLVDEK